MQYENLFIDHHKQSCLPPACQRAIRAVRQALRGESVFPITVALPKALDMVAQAFDTLPPKIITRAEMEIRFIADLWSHQPHYGRTNQLDYFKKIDREIHTLDAFPTLAMLYLLHGDGRLREAALHRITPAMLSPFLFAVLTARVNDWVRPVRQEAAACMARVITPETLAQIAPAIPFLCLQTKTWLRWAENSEAYDCVEATSDVARFMARHLLACRQGPLARQCYAMLHHAAMDAHLPELAECAATPAVRAAAISALLNGETRWPVGQKRQWTDKSFGHYRLETLWETRPVPMVQNPVALALMGAQDRAVAVRRVVAYWLLTTDDPYPEVVDILSQDKYPSIRNAMEFYQRQQAERA